MMAYIARRLLLAIPTLIGITLITFLLLGVAAGDPAKALVSMKGGEYQIEQARRETGTDKPLHIQYLRFLGETFTLDFGDSWVKNRPVSDLILEGIGPSASVTVPAFFLATLIAIALALLCAFYRDSLVDRLTVISAVAWLSVSSLAYIIFGQYWVGYRWNLLPVFGFESGPQGIVFLILPWLIWVAISVGSDVRFFRTVMLEEMGKDYVRTAAAKGVPTRSILFKHILKNAMIPIITRVVIAFPFLFVGSLLLERFFGIPGVGYLSIEAVTTNDYPVIKALVVYSGILYILFTIISDVLYALVDPRVRLR